MHRKPTMDCPVAMVIYSSINYFCRERGERISPITLFQAACSPSAVPTTSVSTTPRRRSSWSRSSLRDTCPWRRSSSSRTSSACRPVSCDVITWHTLASFIETTLMLCSSMMFNDDVLLNEAQSLFLCWNREVELMSWGCCLLLLRVSRLVDRRYTPFHYCYFSIMDT